MTLLEFTLVVVLFSVLAAIFLNRLAYLRVEVERTAIQQTLNQMRSALAVRFAELYIAGDAEALREWDGGNALVLIRDEVEQNPSVPTPSGELPGPGEWQHHDGQILYKPVFAQALTGDPDAVGRWRVELQGTPQDPSGLRLRTVTPLVEDGAKQDKGED